MPVPIPLVLGLLKTFAPLLGGIFAKHATAKGDTALGGQIAALVDDFTSAGGLDKPENTALLIAELEANSAAIESDTQAFAAYAAAVASTSAETQKTIRQEVEDPDVYRRRWRPTLGYCLSLLFLGGGGSILYAFVHIAIASPSELPIFTEAVVALVAATEEPIYIIATLLGGNVLFRSFDKVLTHRAVAKSSAAPDADTALRAAQSVLDALGKKRGG